MVNWGIVGAGNIARAFAQALHRANHCLAFGVAGRNPERVRAFAAEYRIPHAFDSYEAMLAAPEINAVYVALPHALHKDAVMRALHAGKHVLCEKPLALAFGDAAEMFHLANEKHLVLLEGYMYRFHPQTGELVRLLKSGILGRVRQLDAVFSFYSLLDLSSRLWRPELGGGAIWDVGGYPCSMANLVAATMNQGHFPEPERLTAVAEFLASGVDVRAAAVMRFPNGMLARLSCAIDSYEDERVTIYGELGKLTLPNPWCDQRFEPRDGEIILERRGCGSETIRVPADRTSYAYEAEYFAELVEGLRYQAAYPVMTPGESLFQANCMDKLIAEASVEPFHL